MRQCRIYRCGKTRSAMCCVDCDAENCANRCKNHPDRCRCWEDVAVRSQGQRQDVFDHHQIVALRAQGKKILEIAAIVGCGRSTVQAHLSRESKRK